MENKALLPDYSVLMSVYHKEKPENLEEALRSIRTQTVPTKDFVLVADGPLTEELEKVLCSFQNEMGDRFRIHRLPGQGGLGNALNKGLSLCRYNLIARMDSDDISFPDRCERQLTVFQNHPEISICSGTVEEFSGEPSRIEARRVLPEKQEDILRFARKRNPFSHPCVMFRREAVLAAGSFQDFYLLEDYYLWIRMLLLGYKGYNIPEPLLHMRAGKELYKRRSGLRYARSQVRLFRYMKEQGFIRKGECRRSCLLRTVSSLSPNFLRILFFKAFLRQ